MSTSGEGGDALAGRVVAVHRGQVDVELPDRDHWIMCTLRGSLLELRGDQRREEVTPVAVGDNVSITLTDERHGVVEAIEDRRSELARPSTHHARQKQVFCANVDQVAIMVSIRQPRFKSQVVDRLVVIALWGNVDPIVVLTKADLARDGDIEKVRSMYAGFHIPIVELATHEDRGVDRVRELCRGKLTAFCGQSGVGKSTLLNALVGEEIVPTQEVNVRTGKGRHTTSWSEIYRTPDAEIIDLPGNRRFGFFNIPREVIACFLPDIHELGKECRFQPCTHIHEPDCRVQAAVDGGELDPDRHLNYVRIWESFENF